MSIEIPKVIIVVCLTLISSYLNAVKPEIHSADEKYVLSILEKLNVDINRFSTSMERDFKERTEFFKKYGDFKEEYFYKGEYQALISFRTDKNNRIIELKISNVSIPNLKDISELVSLKVLNIHTTSLENLSGIERLVNLVALELINNDLIKSISFINNLPNLKMINAGTSKNISDIAGLRKLPRLEVFDCTFCQLSDVSSLEELKSIVHLKLGGNIDNIEPLAKLLNLQTLEIHSKALRKANSISQLISLKELKLKGAKVNKIDFSNELPNLEKIHLSRVPLKEMPDLSKTPNLKNFHTYGSEIKIVDEGSLPSSLEKLLFEEVRTLKSIPKIENMPYLEELRLSGTGVKNVDLGYLPNLKVLRLSDTQITQLSDFSGVPNLEEIWLFDTKVKSLEPLLDAPKLWIVSLNHTAKNIPNAKLVKKAISQNRKNRYRKPEDQVTAREVYEQLLKEDQDSKPGGSRRRGR